MKFMANFTLRLVKNRIRRIPDVVNLENLESRLWDDQADGIEFGITTNSNKFLIGHKLVKTSQFAIWSSQLWTTTIRFGHYKWPTLSSNSKVQYFQADELQVASCNQTKSDRYRIESDYFKLQSLNLNRLWIVLKPFKSSNRLEIWEVESIEQKF